MTGDHDRLPPLLTLEDYDGDVSRLLDAVYTRFQRDFIETQPRLRGKRVVCKKGGASRGKEDSFWHIVSEGEAEADRTPDLRRYERIGWVRKIIEAADTGAVRCWQNTRGGQRGKRVLLALRDFSYVVVLARRRGYFVLWTAYPVTRGHRRSALRRECDGFEKSSKG